MRVIGGKAKGTNLKSPAGIDIRPTSDRVREAIFSSVQRYIADAVVLDLFAGAGTLGIEALSRYANQVYFVDHSQKHIELIKENLIKTQLLQQAVLICSDAGRAIQKLSDQKIKVDVVFMDPPYEKDLIHKTLEKVGKMEILSPGGVVVVECSKNDALPERVYDLCQTVVKAYGSTRVAYYRRREDE